MTDPDTDRHNAKMAKKKAARDKIMATKTDEKGLVIVHTGKGKGKSSSAFGMIFRCIAHEMPCAVVQFIKGAWDTGERRIIEANFSDLCEFHAMGEGFTWETQSTETDIAAAKVAWQKSKEMLSDETLDIVLLDEMTYMVTYGYIELDEVIAALNNRPKMQHVLITGRACHRRLIELADTVSEVQPIKHAFKAGVKAQKGLDW